MRLPLLSGREVLAALKRLGFKEIHRRGSHVKLTHLDGRTLVFPYHKEIDRATLRGALRDAEVEVEEFPSAAPMADKLIVDKTRIQR